MITPPPVQDDRSVDLFSAISKSKPKPVKKRPSDSRMLAVVWVVVIAVALIGFSVYRGGASSRLSNEKSSAIRVISAEYAHSWMERYNNTMNAWHVSLKLKNTGFSVANELYVKYRAKRPDRPSADYETIGESKRIIGGARSGEVFEFNDHFAARDLNGGSQAGVLPKGADMEVSVDGGATWVKVAPTKKEVQRMNSKW